MIVKRVTSDPVPAVVGMAIKGRPASLTWRDDRIEIALTKTRNARLNRGGCRFRNRFGKDLAVDTSLRKNVVQALRLTQLDHHLIGHDQGSAATQCAEHIGQAQACIGANFHDAGQDDRD
jgi:hypothetical protein